MERIPVFYTPKMVADGGRFSPGSRKPAPVVAAWQAAEYPIEIIDPIPVGVDDIRRVHDPAYVDGVFGLTHKNGFGRLDAELNATLPLTSGSMLSGARHVLAHGGAAASPTAGFHHALYTRGAAYCTFNGLMVTAVKLLDEGLADRVGILDCDVHYGDGTQSIIDRLELKNRVLHFSSGRHYVREAIGFFVELPGILDQLGNCDIVLYQAGADPHIDDPLGGFLDSEGLRRRDRMVFEGLKAQEVPIVWNLAGGYQQKKRPDGSWDISAVLAIHNATMEECCRAWINGGDSGTH